MARLPILALLAALCGCTVDAAEVRTAVLTSPLVGAERITVRGAGVVDEAAPAGGYTYVRVGEVWLVTAGRAPAVGEATAWRGFARVDGFHSRRLDRSFDTLVFASFDAEEE